MVEEVKQNKNARNEFGTFAQSSDPMLMEKSFNRVFIFIKIISIVMLCVPSNEFVVS